MAYSIIGHYNSTNFMYTDLHKLLRIDFSPIGAVDDVRRQSGLQEEASILSTADS